MKNKQRTREGSAATGRPGQAEGPAGEGRLRLAIADGHRHRELAIFAELRGALVPRLIARLRDLGHAVERLELPSDARPFPGARFDCLAETVTGERLTIRCELRPRRWNLGRVGSVHYRVVADAG